MLLPKVYQIQSVTQESQDVFSLALSAKEGEAPSFLPGQFNMLYLFGFGEVPISISGDPSKKGEFVHTIRLAGAVTKAMQKLQKGDEIGVRGPFGTHWPLSQKDCDVLVIAGGLGLAPLRPALFHLAAHRKQYKKITLLYGTRTPEDILYKEELQQWERQGIEVKVSVDRADASWRGHVGVITTLISKYLTAPQNTQVLVCGPEIMIKFAIHELLRTEIDERAIYLSMERNMQCAVGFCGHCQYGPYFLCKDGPVFSYEPLKTWLTIKELQIGSNQRNSPQTSRMEVCLL
ncbi:MAG: FAD/NAD(P)-binding protein [Chlamydiae bacterium]|nr:FAD/NAD(P)-binding protein [Chlamydiota bacterium]